jgi:hypothetical protein
MASTILIGTAVIAVSYWRLASDIGGDVGRLVAGAKPVGTIVTEAMLAGLPEPARRYLRHAGVVGTTIPRLVRLTQRGRIRSSTEAGWMAFEADETYSTNPPAFVWRASFPTPLVPVVLGRDEYLEGSGSIVMKMLAIVPVADAHGSELGAAGLMRYLNEMMWFPAAFLGANVKISPVDDASFAVSITDRGMIAEAVLFIDAEGQPTNFRALRFNTGSNTVEAWETPITAYGTYGGLRLPRTGSAVWKLASGDLDYIELEVLTVSTED